jgi:PAS domain S-box-containing protein
MGIVRDISQRKRAEEALQESYEIINRSPAVVFLWKNAAGWPVEYVSDNVMGLFGHTAEDLMSGRVPYADLVYPDDLNRVDEEVLSYSAVTEIKEFLQEYRIITKDGQVKWIDDLTYIRRNANDEITHYQGIILDITDRKQAEHNLARAHQELDAIFNAAVPFCVINMYYQFIRVNDTFCSYFQLRREEVINRYCYDVWQGPFCHTADCSLKRIMEGSTKYEHEADKILADGTQISCLVTAIPHQDTEGNIIGIIENLTDITEHKQAEEALQKSEELLKATFNATADGILVVDEAGNVSQTNRQFTEMWRIPPDIIATKDDNTLIAYVSNQLEYPDTFQSKIHELYQSSIESLDEIKFKDGRVFERFSCPLIREGKEAGRVWDFRDITMRKQAEETLQHAAYQWQTTFDAMSESVTLLDSRQNIIRCNRAASDIFGKPFSEIVGHHCCEIIHGVPDHVDWCPIKETIETGMPESYIKLMDDRWFSISVDPVRDDSGNIVGAVHIMNDITEIKRAGKALLESEERYKLHFENASDIIFSIGNDLSVLYISPSASKVLGYSPDEIIGKALPDLGIIPTENLDQVLADIKTGLACNQTISSTHEAITKNGTKKSIEISATPTSSDGEPVMIVIGRDVTERIIAEEATREAQQYKELDRLKTNLLSTISHELRTPLASIKGFTSMLIDHDSKMNRNEKLLHLATIYASTDRLIEMVNHLLDMSRLDAGLLKLERYPSSISAIIHQTVAEAKVRVQSHQIVAELEEELPKLDIDSKRIRQVMDNIIDNAVKYSNSGTMVSVQTKQIDTDLLISVADQGIGIPTNKLERVFDRMYRVDHELTAKTGGIGLGLAICKGIVEAHGGRIWIESEEGQGSTCFITLPVYTKEESHKDDSHHRG